MDNGSFVVQVYANAPKLDRRGDVEPLWVRGRNLAGEDVVTPLVVNRQLEEQGAAELHRRLVARISFETRRPEDTIEIVLPGDGGLLRDASSAVSLRALLFAEEEWPAMAEAIQQSLSARSICKRRR